MKASRSGMIVVIGAAVAGILAGSGCLGRAISEGAGVVLGARGKAVEIQPVPPGRPLGEYGAVQFEPLTSDIETRVPDQVLQNIRANTLKMLREAKLFDGGGRPLKISGRVIHFELGGATDQAIGPLQEVIARVKLADGTTGALIGEANIIGRAKSTSAGGAENLAEGCAKGITNWIRKNHPKEKEKEEK